MYLHSWRPSLTIIITTAPLPSTFSPHKEGESPQHEEYPVLVYTHTCAQGRRISHVHYFHFSVIQEAKVTLLHSGEAEKTFVHMQNNYQDLKFNEASILWPAGLRTPLLYRYIGWFRFHFLIQKNVTVSVVICYIRSLCSKMLPSVIAVFILISCTSGQNPAVQVILTDKGLQYGRTRGHYSPKFNG